MMHPMTTRARQPNSGTKEANKALSSKTVLASTHSLEQSESKPIKLPSSPAKEDAIPSDVSAVEALGSTGGHDRDSAVDVSEKDTDLNSDESESN